MIDTRFVARHARRFRLVATGAVTLVGDIRRHLRNESHRTRPASQRVMRQAHVLTHGRSHQLLATTVRAARRSTREIGEQLPDVLGVAAEVDAKGYAVRAGHVDRRTTDDIRTYLTHQRGAAIGAGFERSEHRRLADLGPELKFEYPPSVVLAAPHVLEILTSDAIVSAAYRYLRCEPIFAGIKAWWSLAEPAAPDEKLSGCAQLYHADFDYPAFIKFFLYLTDVDVDNGPFTYIEGTHREKPSWADGRHSDEELLGSHGLAPRVRQLVGPAGTLIAADTSGFHKGTPVRSSPRLLVEAEYAVSRLGATGSTSDSYSERLRPASAFPHTFDIFSSAP